MWFRRDLRLSDNPALLDAADRDGDVLPLFVLDDVLRGPSGAPRLAFLHGCLRELVERTGGRMRVVAGRPEEVVPRVARETGATLLEVAADDDGADDASCAAIACGSELAAEELVAATDDSDEAAASDEATISDDKLEAAVSAADWSAAAFSAAADEAAAASELSRAAAADEADA